MLAARKNRNDDNPTSAFRTARRGDRRYTSDASPCVSPTACRPKRTCTYESCTRLESCSRDPIGYEGSEWNLYEYVSSNPLESTDPFGLQAFNVFACQAAALKNRTACYMRGIVFCALVCSDLTGPSDRCPPRGGRPPRPRPSRPRNPATLPACLVCLAAYMPACDTAFSCDMQYCSAGGAMSWWDRVWCGGSTYLDF